MKKTQLITKSTLLLVLGLFFVLVFVTSRVLAEGDKSKTVPNSLLKTNTTGSVFTFDINNMVLPLDNKGVIAELDLGDGKKGAKYQGIVFLFSGGFFLSGYSNGELFANGVMGASLVNDYVPGPVGSNRFDTKNVIYTVSSLDKQGSDAYKDWATAVSLGADFVDLNGDGVYDPNIDKPDVLGDVTAWCVYNDGLEKSKRRYTDVDPKGIEVAQTVFAFKSKSTIGNMVFVRYRVTYKGLDATSPDKLDSVYFSVAVDPDLGNYADDLVGCDTTISAGFVYNNGPDAMFGANAPCFLMDFFQGPIVYLPGETFVDNNNNGIFDAGDTPIDTAHNNRGRLKGQLLLPGAKNLPMTSFTEYMQSHPTHGDPNTRFEVRNYQIGGLGKLGDPVNPCTWTFGNGSTLSNCAQINPKFMYSGDPVAGTGWINNNPIDQRMMANTGTFTLWKNKPIDIVAAYVIGQDAATSLKSVNVAKKNDIIAQKIFDNNFPSVPPPPSVEYSVKTGADFIDISWPTSAQVSYKQIDSIMSVEKRFQGYQINAYRMNNTNDQISGVTNKTEVGHWAINNAVKNLYSLKSDGGITLTLPTADADYLLDSVTYATPSTGFLHCKITRDPFSTSQSPLPLIKGRTYYFSITTQTLNHFVDPKTKKATIVNRTTKTYGPAGDYVDSTGSAYEEFVTNLIPVVFGNDMYAPSVASATATPSSANTSTGDVRFIVQDATKLTGDTYSVSFEKIANSSPYNAKWTLQNVTKNKVLTTSTDYNFNLNDYSGLAYDGLLVRVKSLTLGAKDFASADYKSVNKKWFQDFDGTATGLFYAGNDNTTPTMSTEMAKFSTYTTFDKARNIEVRFGDSSYAYRYLHGMRGTSVLVRKKAALYAEDITVADTTKNGAIGKFGVGFVKVPFSVWVYDTLAGDKRQVAVAFMERNKLSDFNYMGNPDGNWDPGKNMKSGEFIIAFDAPYDATGNQSLFTGKFLDSTGKFVQVDADLLQGYTVPAAVRDSSNLKVIAKSPLFNALWVIGMIHDTANHTFTSGDVLKAQISAHPYTSKDVFSYTTRVGGSLTDGEQKSIFDKVTVFPNPLFAYNPYTGLDPTNNPDDPFVTFGNLPKDVTIKIFSLSGQLVRTLHSDGTPFLKWDLTNEAHGRSVRGLRVASGVYIAIVSSPQYGDKILKFSVIMPQKQIPRY
ncbi:MAG: hypothetical protein LWX56_13040 [Ignavibacteria bacterium]|nr:hypothetical protein [Ignavibacteria bacterium]